MKTQKDVLVSRYCKEMSYLHNGEFFLILEDCIPLKPTRKHEDADVNKELKESNCVESAFSWVSYIPFGLQMLCIPGEIK